MSLSVRASNLFLIFTGAGAKEWKLPAGVMLRRPGGVAGAPPPAEGHEGALCACHAGWAAAIHGGVAASACPGQATGGHCASTGGAAAAQSVPWAQFQSAPAPT